MLEQKQASYPGDGVMAYSDDDKANMLNSFFSSCFNVSHPSLEVENVSTARCSDEILCSESEVSDLLASLVRLGDVQAIIVSPQGSCT